jgi:hypothetical protein
VGRLGRWLGRLLRVAGVLVLLLAVAWLLRVPVFGGLVKREVAKRLAEALGGRYEVARVGGSWLGDLEVEGVRQVEPPADGAVVGLEVARARARYDLLGLLRGRGLEAVHEVGAEGVLLEVDPARDPGGRPRAERPAIADLGLPEVRATGEVRVLVGAGAITLRDVSLEGRGSHLDVVLPDVLLPGDERLEGRLAGRLEVVDGEVRWSSDTTLGGIAFPEGRYGPEGSGGRLVVAGGEVQVTVDAEGAVAEIAGLDLAALPPWLLRRLGEAPRSGTVAARLRRLPGGGTAFDVSVEGLVWHEESVDSLRARGTWDGGHEVHLESAVVLARSAEARIDDAVLDARLPFWVRRAERIEVDVTSLRAFAPDAPRDLRLRLRARSPSPDVVELEELVAADRGLFVRARGRATLPADPEAWRETALSGEGTATVSDLAPFDEGAFRGTARLDARLGGTIADPEVAFTATADGAAVEGHRLDRLRATGSFRGERVEVTSLLASAHGATIEARGWVREGPEAEVTAFTLEAPDVSPLVERFAPGAGVTGSVRLAGRLSLEPRRLDAAADLVASDLAWGGVEVARLGAHLSFDGSVLQADGLLAEGPWGQVGGRLAFEPDEQEIRVGSLEVGHGDRRWRLEAPWEASWAGDIVRVGPLEVAGEGGRLRLEGTVEPRLGRATVAALEVATPDVNARLATPLALRWSGDVVEATGLHAALDGTTVEADLRADLAAGRATALRLAVRSPDLEARLNAPLVLTREGDAVRVEALRATVEGVAVEARGVLHPDRSEAVVEALRVAKDGRSAALAAPARVAWSGDGVAVEGLEVDVLGGRVRGRAFHGEGRLAATATLEGIDLADALPVGGTLEGHVAYEDGRLLASVRVPDVRWGPWTGKVLLEARQEQQGGLALDRIFVEGPQGGSVSGKATLPFRVGPEGVSRVVGVEPRLDLEGRLDGLTRLSALLQGPVWLRARGDGAGLVLDVRADDVLLGDGELPRDDLLVQVRLAPDALRAEVRLRSDAFLTVRGGVRLDRGADWTDAEALAALRHAWIEGEVAVDVADWKPLERLAEVREAGGKADARLRVTGTVSDPLLDGSLRLDDFTFAADSDVPAFQRVDAEATWSGREVRIARLEGLMGHAPFSVAGTVALPAPGQRFPVLDLAVKGENTLLIRSRYVRLRVDLDTRVKGPLDDLLVTGRARIADFLFREPLSLESAGSAGEREGGFQVFTVRDWPFSAMRFDVDVSASRSLRIRNNLLRADLSLDAHLGGTLERPEPTGRATFENADVFLPLTTLRKATGHVEFPADAPLRPRIQMTAEARSRGYEISVQLAGTLPDVDLFVFTEPYLDPDDALFLVATGATGEQLASDGLAGTVLRSAVKAFGGTLFTTGGTEGAPGDLAFFDRFYFVTEEGASYTGQDLISAEIELSDVFFLRAERDMYDETNAGVLWRLRLR